MHSAEWGFTSFFASNNSASRGVAILFNNNFEFKVKNVYRNKGGNYLIIHISTKELDVLLVNIYGPNRDDPEFYGNLKREIDKRNIPNIILGGDWNLVLDPTLDYYNYKHVNNPKAREKVEELIEENSFVDIWRDLNPQLQRFTWRRTTPIQQSRLDFFLVSEHLCSYNISADILPGYRTDHSLITLRMLFGDEIKKKTFWKFNSSLLKDSRYVNEIKETIEKVIDQYAATPYDRQTLKNIETENIQFTISDRLILDVMLMEIRGKTISYASMKKKVTTEKEKTLESDIATLEEKAIKDEVDLETIKAKNKMLEELRQIKMQGVLLRSRARWVAEGEKVTKYFCGLEKRNYICKQMTKVVGTNGDIKEKTTEIVKEAKSFYEHLYETRETTDCRIEECVKNMPTLTKEESQALEGEITLEEASKALKKMKNYKSPGTDGFTVEFFKFFWRKRIGELVKRSINESFNRGELSSTQKEGIIICLPKGDKPRQYLKNWRPISLLNVVYKIASTCIAERLKVVLLKLVNEDQSGFIPNRNIGNNIRLIYDLINFCNTNNISGLLMCIDFEKAFDSLDWVFMHKVLAAYGFGEDIKRWIKVFYTGMKSAVQINGCISDWFSINRGCRQGDPLSPYLFILCAEILAIMIRENNNINGILTGEVEHKISQFADDTELFQKGDRQSFEETIQILDHFGNISGLKLNIDKTDIVWIGSKMNSKTKYMPHLKFRWNPPKFKILGIWFTNDLKECVQLNFDEKYQEIKTLYLIWLKRLITPLGRIAVLKSLILSKLVYLWQLLPNPPDHYITDLQKLIFRFVWNRKRNRINRNTSIKCIKDGGLGIPDIKNLCYSHKLTWIKRMKQSDQKWKHILSHNYRNIKRWQYLGPSAFANEIHNNIFWKQTFEIYENMRYRIKPTNSSELLSEPLFYNKNITINNKTIIWKAFVQKDMYFIGNLVDETGHLYTYEQLINEYNITVNPLTYLGLVKSIGKYSRDIGIEINENNTIIEPRSVKIINLPVKGVKHYYELLLNDLNKPKFCNKWNNILRSNINWQRCYEIVRKIKEIKLKWFQIRVVHRIIATNIILKEMGITDSNLCDLCKKERDSIKHFLWDCEHIQNFWNELLDCMRNLCNIPNSFAFNEILVILGADDTCKTDNTLDFIIISAKYYIYQCKYEKAKPNVQVFRRKLKYKYDIELYNHKIQMTEEGFKTKWESHIRLITID